MVPEYGHGKAFCFQETAEMAGQCKIQISKKHLLRKGEEEVQAVVDNTPENLSICREYCGTCPSFPFPQQPFLFCARGCSQERVVKKGCNCSSCPIYSKYRLQGLYFCETGIASGRKKEAQEVPD